MPNTEQEIIDRITKSIIGYKVGDDYYIGRSLARKKAKKSGLKIEQVVIKPKVELHGRRYR